MNKHSGNILIVLIFLLSMLAASCENKVPSSVIGAGTARIFPDYNGITIPVNIAPLNFNILEPADQYLVHFHTESDRGFIIRSGNGKISIPERKWKAALGRCHGSDLLIDIFFRRNRHWHKFEPVRQQVSADSIDSFLAYRLIEPGFETWNQMGIYQRNLQNFQENPLMVNAMSDGNCMNCHSFASHRSTTLLFHTRAEHGGTVVLRNGNIQKVNTKTDSTISAGVYPSWHPGGRYVAFSVNRIVQSFHSLPDKRIEVIDTLSDLILYDAEKNCVIKDPLLTSPGRFETFPSWSPDGRYLYFCSAGFRNFRDYQQIRYDLLRISFDADMEKFGETDTVICAGKNGYSISFPRVSPDGRYLLFCKTRYGSFTIWHDDSDLILLDLESGHMVVPEINSNKTESYHTWSSNGRWIVFSSRRQDGLYTRLYFSHFDRSGRFHKPFLLPQRAPGYNTALLKSYNVPEFVTSKIDLEPRFLARIVKSEAAQASFRKSGK